MLPEKTVEEYCAQIDELTKVNTDLQNQLTAAKDALEAYEQAKKTSLIEAIKGKSDFIVDELTEKTLDELEGINMAPDKAKINYKPVTSTGDDEGKPTGLTVGLWDAKEGKWVTSHG
jgi:hypothetical protein